MCRRPCLDLTLDHAWGRSWLVLEAGWLIIALSWSSARTHRSRHGSPWRTMRPQLLHPPFEFKTITLTATNLIVPFPSSPAPH